MIKDCFTCIWNYEYGTQIQCLQCIKYSNYEMFEWMEEEDFE